MRHEVDSNFFELLTLYPPPVPLLWGNTPTKCKGGKKGTQNTADGLPPCRGFIVT